MIEFDEGKLSMCGRVTEGWNVGWVVAVDRDTFIISWSDGRITAHTRKDDEEA